jgi:hypothetical protein
MHDRKVGRSASLTTSEDFWARLAELPPVESSESPADAVRRDRDEREQALWSSSTPPPSSRS